MTTTFLLALPLLTTSLVNEEPLPVKVQGTVIYAGPVPKPVPVPEALKERHIIERDAKTNGLKDAVVWIEGAKRPLKEAWKKVVMDQREFFFVPHVLAVRPGQAVEFLNSDSANHGVQANSSARDNTFNIVTPAGASYTHRFVSCRHPVRIGCPIHATMAAWVFVFDHPYFAITDAQGKFQLPALPPGKYRLHIHHASGELRHSQELIVEKGRPLSLKLELKKKPEKE